LYASANIIRAMKSRRMTWEGHVARTGDMRSAHNILGILKGIDHSEGLGVDANIMLEWILGK
jgi:hypothetical protein